MKRQLRRRTVNRRVVNNLKVLNTNTTSEKRENENVSSSILVVDSLNVPEVDDNSEVDSSSGDEYGPENVEDNRTLLKNWSLKHNITHIALSDLLKLCKAMGANDLPSDARTLLHTPVSVNILKAPGEYWHAGLVCSITQNILASDNCNVNNKLKFSIDGLPVSKSSKG